MSLHVKELSEKENEREREPRRNNEKRVELMNEENDIFLLSSSLSLSSKKFPYSLLFQFFHLFHRFLLLFHRILNRKEKKRDVTSFCLSRTAAAPLL